MVTIHAKTKGETLVGNVIVAADGRVVLVQGANDREVRAVPYLITGPAADLDIEVLLEDGAVVLNQKEADEMFKAARERHRAAGLLKEV